MQRLRFLAFATCFVAKVTLVSSQDPICVNQSSVDLSQDLPYFRARFPDITIKTPRKNPYLGGRNQTYCCIQAIDSFLRQNCTDADQIQIEPKILENGTQFPCGASWAGDDTGAPLVKATYNWTENVCPGWTISEGPNVSQWAQLLVAFILPCVVFSFNIPRPRKLKIWEQLFPKDLSSYRVIAGLAGAAVAAICVTVDTVIWLMVSFAFAGPLLLSGLYEAQLDKRVLHYLEENITHDKLPLGLRARILFTILCGNLDLYPAWSDTMDLARHLDKLDRLSSDFIQRPQQAPFIQVIPANDEVYTPRFPGMSNPNHSQTMPGPSASDGASMASRNDSFDEARDTDPLRTAREKHRQTHFGVISRDHSRTPILTHESASLERIGTASSIGDYALAEVESVNAASTARERAKTIRKVTVRLRSMLACQYSFGSTIGGPVVFFLGSFIYALLEIKQSVGNEDLAEALAFGMWWIIIPHVAAVAGLLLAGNNPNILEGIVSIRDLKYAVGESLTDRALERRATVDTDAAIQLGLMQAPKASYSNIFERVYSAGYTPAWMWDRGKCKQDWLLVLFTDAWLKYRVNGRLPMDTAKGLERFLVKTVMLSTGDWIFLWSFAFLLIFIPCMFALITAYYTPEIGIACRSITFIVYMGAQTLLLLLWAYYLTWRDKYWATAQKIKRELSYPKYAQVVPRIESLIVKLKAQATRDTTMSVRDRRRLGDRVSVYSETAEVDILTALDRRHPVAKWLFYIGCAFGFIVSLVSSIGGTLFQVIGIYRANICLLRADHWIGSRRSQTYATLSSNSVESIHAARKFWLIIGTCSVVFLAGVCYVGWWYQKRLRASFQKIAGQLDGDRGDREMTTR